MSKSTSELQAAAARKSKEIRDRETKAILDKQNAVLAADRKAKKDAAEAIKAARANHSSQKENLSGQRNGAYVPRSEEEASLKEQQISAQYPEATDTTCGRFLILRNGRIISLPVGMSHRFVLKDHGYIGIGLFCAQTGAVHVETSSSEVSVIALVANQTQRTILVNLASERNDRAVIQRFDWVPEKSDVVTRDVKYENFVTGIRMARMLHEVLDGEQHGT
jgi:hypothetical protein